MSSLLLCSSATQLHIPSCRLCLCPCQRFSYYLAMFLAISSALTQPGRLGDTSARAEDSSETVPKLPFWGSVPFPSHSHCSAPELYCWFMKAGSRNSQKELESHKIIPSCKPWDFLISFWCFSFCLETTRTKYLFYLKYMLWYGFPHNHTQTQTQARHQKADVGTTRN